MDYHFDGAVGFVADYSGTLTMAELPFLDATSSRLFVGPASSPTRLLGLRVTPVAPRLRMERSDVGVTVSWPTSAGSGWRLQVNTNLSTPAGWTEVSGTYPIHGTEYAATNAGTSPVTLFRLVRR